MSRRTLAYLPFTFGLVQACFAVCLGAACGSDGSPSTPPLAPPTADGADDADDEDDADEEGADSSDTTDPDDDGTLDASGDGGEDSVAEDGSSADGSSDGSADGSAGDDSGDGGNPGDEGEPSDGVHPPAKALPKVDGACPDLKDGTVTVAGSKVKLWVGSKPGPIYFYFHGTGSTPDEVKLGLPGAAEGVKTNGGMVASWDASSGEGLSTGSVWRVWFTGDFDAADQLLACAIEKGIADTSRIHAAGYSAGGLQTGAMVYMRSNYLASVVVYSGGKGFIPDGIADPNHVPAVLGAHGAQGSDVVLIDFHDYTMKLEEGVVDEGGFAVDCGDDGAHIELSRLGVQGKAMEFLAAHPYAAMPSPYASGLPDGWPSYCSVVQ